MRFELTTDQRDFADALESLLAASDTAKVNRAWAAGDHEPGMKLWSRLAEMGLTALPSEATPVELCLAFEALGRHVVPGPWVETVAYLQLTEGIGTVANPYALDADIADEVYALVDGTLREAEVGDEVASIDRSRRLFTTLWSSTGEERADESRSHPEAFDLAALATSAQLLGAGERVLTDTVAYAKQRRQFNREIGSYQAIKHQLADVRIALDFARPLVYGAAVEPTARSVSAAKIQAADAADLAARVGLQVHGAIGYTEEHDLSLWLLRIRALRSAWGTPTFHRERLLADLLGSR